MTEIRKRDVGGDINRKNTTKLNENKQTIV